MLAISRIEGQTSGLKAKQINSIRRLLKRRVRPELLISLELAREISELTLDIGRQIGLLLNRAGTVSEVIIGDSNGLVLPVIGRERGGLTRLKGLRLIHTHLRGENLTQDDLNDLAMLRLDMVAVILVGEDGFPRHIEAAHLLPANDGDQTMAFMSGPNVTSLNLDFTSFIRSLEYEFTRTQSEVQITGSGERAILISVSAASRFEAEEHLDELEELSRTAGLEVLDRILLRRRENRSSRLLSRNRLSRLTIRAFQLGADLIVFDQDLSPVEIARLADLTELRIIDRTQLILDIFAQRARTREGKIQVEMAQLNYLLPRLIKKATAMSRLTGGIGGRGPGETKLEINRRRVRDRITRLNKELKTIKSQRGRHRARRAREGLPIVSIIGYTNAGKSTLLNNLTNSRVTAENKLFVTLDPTSRRLRFPKDRAIIITDTVGFIRDLPAELIEAFAATLEELSSADLLLHVVDVSNPRFQEQIETVENLLVKLGLSRAPILRTLNKIDLIDDDKIPGLVNRYKAVALSAQDPKTFPPLIEKLQNMLNWSDVPPAQRLASSSASAGL
ncbi:MAG: GTPase HflX [Candidatus Adiutricales bacterium]